MELSLDFETYSEADLPAVGTYRYATDPTTEALMLGWAIDDEPISIWNIHAGHSIPQRLEAAIKQPACQIWSFNAPFERLILKHVMGYDLPLDRFYCTMVYAYALGFMGRLDEVLDQFNIPLRKDAKGNRLIHRFCKPQPVNRKVRRWTLENDPEGFREFMIYCMQDVHVERYLRRRIEQVSPVVVWPHYHLDQEINDRGLPVDRGAILAALQLSGSERERLLDRMHELTKVPNPNSRDQLLEWINDHDGIELPDLKKTTVAREIEYADYHEDYPPVVRETLKLKQEVAKTSVSKWKAMMLTSTDDDPWIRGVFQFLGAGRTGRWAGRVFQPHNLPRTLIENPELAIEFLKHGLLETIYDRPLDALSSAIRAAIEAPEDHRLVVADLSSIESRLAGWVADCAGINRIFANDLDVYKDLAADIFGVPYSEVTKQQRTDSKPAALGAQYMLSALGLVRYASDMGIELSKEEAELHIATYREKYHEIRSFWYDLLDAYVGVIQDGQPRHLERINVWVRRNDHFLEVILPTGRSLFYYQPTYEPWLMPWKKNGEDVYKDSITYMGKNQYTQQWERIGTHPGKLLENLIQAIARDVLMVGILRARNRGLIILGHVHDEIICLARTDDAGWTLNTLETLMSAPIQWAPGLLLGAKGYIAQRYRKD